MLFRSIQGYDSLDQGDYATAALMFRDSLLKNVKAVDRQGIAACLTAYAGLAMKKVDYIRVGKLLGAAEAFIDVVHAPLQPSDMELYRSYRADLVDKLDDATLKSARDEGRAMTMQQAIAYALQE